MFRDPVLSASLAMSTLVSTVMMTTMVVGPFNLSQALGLKASLVGFVLSAGPMMAALTGFPAGRIVDRFGSQRMTLVGLVGIAGASVLLSIIPMRFGIAGYISPIVLMTASYALFQAANNTSIMNGVHPEQRGVISGMLSLSRNVGLITGASVMGAVFSLTSASSDMTQAEPMAVAAGMQRAFAIAAALIVFSLVIAIVSHVHSQRSFVTSRERIKP
jgi:MFS family permease